MKRLLLINTLVLVLLISFAKPCHSENKINDIGDVDELAQMIKEKELCEMNYQAIQSAFDSCLQNQCTDEKWEGVKTGAIAGTIAGIILTILITGIVGAK